ncbi:imm11 family protein [Pyxidicoccus sp. 3LFB2]
MVDHHSLPEPVVSLRLKEVLGSLQLHGVQWVPAAVHVRENDVRRYWLMHMWRELRCMDSKRSVFKAAPSGLFLLSLDRLVRPEHRVGQPHRHSGAEAAASVARRIPVAERRWRAWGVPHANRVRSARQWQSPSQRT